MNVAAHSFQGIIITVLANGPAHLISVAGPMEHCCLYSRLEEKQKKLYGSACSVPGFEIA